MKHYDCEGYQWRKKLTMTLRLIILTSILHLSKSGPYFGISGANISHIAIEVKREEEKNCPKAVRQTHIIITDTLLWVNVICTPWGWSSSLYFIGSSHLLIYSNFQFCQDSEYIVMDELILDSAFGYPMVSKWGHLGIRVNQLVRTQGVRFPSVYPSYDPIQACGLLH